MLMPFLIKQVFCLCLSLVIIIISSLIKPRSYDLGYFLTLNCSTTADLLIIVGSEPLRHTSIIN